MKKIYVLLLCLFIIVGCSNNENINESESMDTTNLKDPVIDWCQVYNPNGYNTVTCLISNPNTVDIDVSYDLVYYKNGKEVARNEDYSNFQISNSHKDVIWSNYDVPNASDVDEVKMENIYVSKAYSKALESEIKYTETIQDKVYFSVKNNKNLTLNNIWIFEYNDDNGNKKCDKGELLVVDIKSTTEIETKISVDKDVYNANSYEVYYNAY